MCLPALGAIPMILMQVASTAMTIIGQVANAQSQKAAADANAQTARMQARDAERRGSIAEGQQRMKTNLIVAAQHAQQGSSGLVADEGTGADVLAQSAEYGARDAATLRVNAQREAWGYRRQAQLDEYQGQQAMASLPLKIGGTVLTGVANTFAKSPWWSSYVNKPDNEIVPPGSMGTGWGPSTVW